MSYQTYIPETWREMRERERSESRSAKRKAIANERIRTEQLTRFLRTSGKVLLAIGKIGVVALVVIATLALAFGGSPTHRRR